VTTLRQLIGRAKLQRRGKNHIVGWSMTLEEILAFFKGMNKTVLTFYGYSGVQYQDEKGMLQIAENVLSKYSPKTTLVNIGATSAGIGAIYPLARAKGFITTGIVATRSLKHPESISEAVEYVCFVPDEQWGGKLHGSDELSPTSKAMVACSDILVGIGGGDISLHELLAGEAQGKKVLYFPAEMNHEKARREAERKGLPPPTSFKGSAHDTLIGLKRSALQKTQDETKDQ